MGSAISLLASFICLIAGIVNDKTWLTVIGIVLFIVFLIFAEVEN